MHHRTRPYFQAWGRPIQEDKAGNIYYVRLKTPFGPFYKLGFTTMASVQERLAFQGAGHETQIDAVLGFAASPNALSIEQTLHGHFSHKQAFGIPDALMPFAGNGQSELYVEDILSMDEEFTREQARRVRASIAAQRTGESVQSIEAKIEQRESDAADFEELANLRFVWPICWIWRAWRKVEEALFTSPAKKEYQARVQGLIQWYRGSVAERRDQASEARAQRIAKLRRLNRALKLSVAADEKRKRDAQELRAHALNAPFGVQLTKALRARETRDLQNFEILVDVERLVYNLAEAMTEDLTFGSDYMIVANNCGLLDLVDAISDGNPRDVLMAPVQEGYKALLRHWVTTGELLSEDLSMPPDPRFHRTMDGEVRAVSPISTDYFGPSCFLEKFGRQWHWPTQPSRASNDWAEFDVAVYNTATGFRGQLVVRAELIAASGQLAVSFPDFLAVYRAALRVLVAHTSGDSAASASGNVLPTPEEKALLREITGFGNGGEERPAGEH